MSRSGYSEDLDPFELGRYRAAVESAMFGKRGQKFLCDMIAALDAMPVKELISGTLEEHGEVCALGALGRARGVDMSNLEPEDAEAVGKVFKIAESLAREVVSENDGDFGVYMTPAMRWEYMRRWAAGNLREVPA
jgi:hypothetical protein